MPNPPRAVRINVPDGITFAQLKLRRVAGSGVAMYDFIPVSRILKASHVDLRAVEDENVRRRVVNAALVALHQSALESGESIPYAEARLLREIVGPEFANAFADPATDAFVGHQGGEPGAGARGGLRVTTGEEIHEVATMSLTVPDDVHFADLVFRSTPSGEVAFEFGPIDCLCRASGVDADLLRRSAFPKWQPFLVALYESACVRGETIDARQLDLFRCIVPGEHIGPVLGNPTAIAAPASGTLH